MKKLILLLFLLSALFFSCKKETVNLTQGQLTALRLQKELGVSPNITSNFGSIFVLNKSTGSLISSGGTSLMITNDGFIVISGTNGFLKVTFNLEHLNSYRIDANNLSFVF